ncbi:MAG: putative regulator of nonsense transcripts 1 [Streblomastix strix]|uniref:Putative regulator of nonsense transcripts 1 n=1 Tax=Streblomastix strix TaxID=222440 RepID=A0A5J4WJQ7_9EUKA|nr:MAG: putative regulator of nonsense transcripts 1 [Streblomastix strix]
MNVNEDNEIPDVEEEDVPIIQFDQNKYDCNEDVDYYSSIDSDEDFEDEDDEELKKVKLHYDLRQPKEYISIFKPLIESEKEFEEKEIADSVWKSVKVFWEEKRKSKKMWCLFEIPTYRNNSRVGLNDTMLLTHFDSTGTEDMTKKGVIVKNVALATKGQSICLEFKNHLGINKQLGDNFTVKLLLNMAQIEDDLSISNFVKLDASQSKAVHAALTRPLSLIQGPPGTGKTVVSATIVYHWVKMRQGQILVCAPSDVAADNLTEKIATVGLNVVRFEARSRETILSPVEKYTLSYQVKVSQTKEAEIIRQLYKQEEKDFDQDENMMFNQLINSVEKDIISKCDVICCTLSSAGDNRLKSLQFKPNVQDRITFAEVEFKTQEAARKLFDSPPIKRLLCGILLQVSYKQNDKRIFEQNDDGKQIFELMSPFKIGQKKIQGKSVGKRDNDNNKQEDEDNKDLQNKKNEKEKSGSDEHPILAHLHGSNITRQHFHSILILDGSSSVQPELYQQLIFAVNKFIDIQRQQDGIISVITYSDQAQIIYEYDNRNLQPMEGYHGRQLTNFSIPLQAAIQLANRNNPLDCECNLIFFTSQDCCICFVNEINKLNSLNIWIDAIGFQNADQTTLEILVRGGGHQSMAQTMEEVYNIFVQLAQKQESIQVVQQLPITTNLPKITDDPPQTIYDSDPRNNFVDVSKQISQMDSKQSSLQLINPQSPLLIIDPNFNVKWTKQDFQNNGRIGSGGFGTICLVKEKQSGKHYARKEMNYGTPKEIEMVNCEVRIIKEINEIFHRSSQSQNSFSHVIEPLGFFVDEDEFKAFLVMEY